MSLEAPAAAPVLSTPESHIFEDPTPPASANAFPRLSDEQLYLTYEVDRTLSEIRRGRWRRVALQFPDDMLVDAPRVYDRLRHGLSESISWSKKTPNAEEEPSSSTIENLSHDLASMSTAEHEPSDDMPEPEAKLTILGDTSYGACCVDEIAAEHVDAEVVVHYGRTCLSPTARLPVIYVFTTRPLDEESVVASFVSTYPDNTAKVILMADIPYHGHVEDVFRRLRNLGYSNLLAPSVVHDPSSPLPNRDIQGEKDENAKLRDYSLFHIADPPPSLLLNVLSKVASIYIYPVGDSVDPSPPEVILPSTAQMLRRRYALVTRLSTVPIFGILINTLSVKNYIAVLEHVKDLISRAGKKYYTFVVGKVNAAKVANFQEVDGWVVIGCWESSLLESKEFWKPIITPYELELALTDERDRLWTGEWNSDIQALLTKSQPGIEEDGGDDGEVNRAGEVEESDTNGNDGARDFDSEEESEPPVFDLRTGKYVSQSRPMARPSKTKKATGTNTSLIKRANGDLAQIGGEVSPAAEFLRAKRTWQGLGSDYEIAYQYDEQGKMQGAPMEQGRSGIARGYAVNEDEA